MRINEIAPSGREKQVKALKKKFDDKGAQLHGSPTYNKHGAKRMKAP